MKGDRGQPRKSVIPEMLRSERRVDWFNLLVYWWEIRDGFTTAVNPAIVSSQGDQLQLDKKLAGKNVHDEMSDFKDRGFNEVFPAKE